MLIRRRRRSPFLRHGDPVDQREFAQVMFALRVELLRLATDYAVAAVCETPSEDGVQQVRGWLNWLDDALSPILAQAAELRVGLDDVQRSRTSKRLRGRLARIEDPSDGEDRGFPDPISVETWAEALELLTLRARAVERFGTEPLGEEEGEEFGQGVFLLGATEASMVLAESASRPRRALRTTAAETYERLVAARSAGVWELLKALGAQEATVRRRKRPKPGRNSSPSDQDFGTLVETRRRLLLTLTDTGVFLANLAPDGRALSQDERTNARERLEVGAVCLQEAMAHGATIASFAREGNLSDLTVPISALRRCQRSLVLACSTDPHRRSFVGSSRDHAALVQAVLKRFGVDPKARES